jgi:hypothetical protein
MMLSPLSNGQAPESSSCWILRKANGKVRIGYQYDYLTDAQDTIAAALPRKIIQYFSACISNASSFVRSYDFIAIALQHVGYFLRLVPPLSDSRTFSSVSPEYQH